MTGKGKFQTSTSILLLVEFFRISGSKFYWLPPEKENTVCIMPHCALLDQKTQVPWIYCLFNKSKMLKEHVASKAPTNSHSIGGEAGEAIKHNYCPSVTKKLIEMLHEVWSQLTANALSQSDWGHTKHCSQCKRGLVVTMNYTEGILGNVCLAWCTLIPKCQTPLPSLCSLTKLTIRVYKSWAEKWHPFSGVSRKAGYRMSTAACKNSYCTLLGLQGSCAWVLPYGLFLGHSCPLHHRQQLTCTGKLLKPLHSVHQCHTVQRTSQF